MICGSRVVATCHTGAYSPSSSPRNSVFRVMSSVRHSKPSPFLVRHSELHLQFDVQGRVFSIWHSDPLVSLAFKCHHISSVWHSKPLVNLAFRATIFLQFSVQSHIPSIQSCYFLLVQLSEPHCQHLELSFSFSLAFKVIFFALDVWSPELTTQSRSSYLCPRVILSIQSPKLMTKSHSSHL